jgi:hypothetical protein
MPSLARRAREGPRPRCCPDPLLTTHLLTARPWCARCRREIAPHEYASRAPLVTNDALRGGTRAYLRRVRMEGGD